MYGLIGRIEATPGGRDQLAAVLSDMASLMPGCLSYVVAEDLENDDALWVTEIWVDADHHTASLDRPEVKAAITAGRPLIAGFGHRFETRPVSGVPHAG
jgi:quinol monooxygenase YgiN